MESNFDLITLCEHEKLSEDLKAKYDEQLANVKFEKRESDKPPKFLGFYENQANYYVGTCSLTEKLALTVLPKIDVDFVELFWEALNVNDKNAGEYFSFYYGFDFEKPAVPNTTLQTVLSPLLVVHYVATLENLLKLGLKKGYVTKEENLKSKVRGRIKILQNERKNLVLGRGDRVYCKFQEYTCDIAENRLLKRALLFAKKMLQKSNTCDKQFDLLIQKINKCNSSFENVSDQVSLSEIRSIKQNKLYRDYGIAINIAKLILKRFDNSLSKIDGQEKSVPQFWLDMPRVYEMFVYSKLKKIFGESVQFQVAGSHKTKADFIETSEKLILDAKYKPHYENGNGGIMDDIREISGYARDEILLKKLNIDTSCENAEVPACVIIYPVMQYFDDEKSENTKAVNYSELSKENFIEKCEKITDFYKFYKVAFELPIQQKKGD